jgi:hypothetical protein
LLLFADLERIVHDAGLSRAEAALIAGELEAVSLRWEPPELVLRQLCRRLDGLEGTYEPTEPYPRLLLVVGVLLTIVCAHLTASEPSVPVRRSSGLRLAADAVPTPLRHSKRH